MLAVVRREREIIGVEARFHRAKGRFNPRIIPGMREQGDFKFQHAVKRVSIKVTIAKYEISGRMYRKIITPEQPLIDFHLPLIPLLPFTIEGDLRIRSGGFVVDNNQLACRVNPHIINTTPHGKMGSFVIPLDTPTERIAPLVNPFMLERYCVNAVFGHVRM